MYYAGQSGEFEILAPGAPVYLCRFKSVVYPDGRWQVTVDEFVAATLQDPTEISCVTPQAGFLGDVEVEIALNGQDYSNSSYMFQVVGNLAISHAHN